MNFSENGQKTCPKSGYFRDFLFKTMGATNLNFQCSPSEHHKTVSVRETRKSQKIMKLLIFPTQPPALRHWWCHGVHSGVTVVTVLSIFSYGNVPDWLAKFCPFS